MTGSTRLGVGIAALFAAGVFAVYLFDDHSSWFTRAAQDNAVRCLTQSACPRLTLEGPIVTSAAPPLTGASRCAKPESWHEMARASGAQKQFVVACTDGTTYLYHMGSVRNSAAGNEQWMACEAPDCKAELRALEP